MPATAERPRPIPIPSLLDDAVPPRRRSPPPYPKLSDTKNLVSPPSPVTSPPPKQVLSPKSEKKTLFTPPPESELKKLDKLEPKPEPKSEPKPEIKDPQPEQKEEDVINMETFQQILELDDDGGDEFSREMVWAFFTQAESTFQSMDTALKEKNLSELSSLGHFLKGSSAALGVCKVQASCEKIQHFGQLRDGDAGSTITSKEALERIDKLLSQVKTEYIAAENWLKLYYKDGSS